MDPLIILVSLIIFIIGGIAGYILSTKMHENKIKDIEKISNQLFRDLNEEIISSNEEKLKNYSKGLETKQDILNETLKPITEKLSSFQSKIDSFEIKNNQRSTQINQTFSDLKDMTGEFARLFQKPQYRGNWGEKHLRNLLEQSGLIRHVDFLEQTTVQTSEMEKNNRPDCIIKLPNDKSLAVDSKVPTEHYYQAIKEDNEVRRDEYFKKHSESVFKHIKHLSSKEYQKSIENSPDFTIMYFPNEGIFFEAQKHRLDLFEQCMKYNIIIATPMNFFALCKTIQMGFVDRSLTDNAKQIKFLANQLGDRLKKFSDHFSRIGKSLDSANKSYNSAVGSFKKMLMPSVNKFKDLDVSNENLTEIDLIEEENDKIDQ